MLERDQLIAAVQGLQQGDDQAFSVLYEHYKQDIYYHILKTVEDPDMAEDLMQETFMEIMDTIHKLQEPAAFVTWARRIAYHRCTAYFRKGREIVLDEEDDGYSAFDTLEEDREDFIPGEALDKEDLKQTIQAMIAQLPMEQRQVLLMRYFDEISVKEIADTQGVSEGTVKSRLNYARKSIKQAVEEYEKKHDIKLHSSAMVPLLLWLAWQLGQVHKAENGSAVVAGTSMAAGSAGATATGTTVATSTAVVTGSTTVAASTATAATTTAAATTGTSLVTKLVAGILAAVVAIGGTIGAVTHWDDLFPAEPQATEQNSPTTPTEPEAPTTPEPEPEPQFPRLWVGYGDYLNPFYPHRYEFEVYEMDETSLSGRLNIEKLYAPIYETQLTGTGTVNDDGTIRYVVQLDTILNDYYTQLEFDYDPQAQTFYLGRSLDVTVAPADLDDQTVLVQDQAYAGAGESKICYSSKDHYFEMQIHQLTATALSGQLTITKDGAVEHTSAFTGRGYVVDGGSIYEIHMESPHVAVIFGDLKNTVDSFWMTYSPENDQFEITSSYAVVMSRVTDTEPEPEPDFGPPSEGLEFSLSFDGSYYILSGIGDCMDTEIVIPTEYAGLPVKQIRTSIFSNGDITSIVIPYGITEIQPLAFSNCSSLENVYISASVTTIGSGAFAYCSSLNTITVASGNPNYRAIDNCLIDSASKTLIAGCNTSVIPEDGSVVAIGDRAFAFREFESIVIPEGVTLIDDYAFFGCSNLTNITVADSVTTIGDHAFLDCVRLQSFIIPAGTTTLGSEVFTYCDALMELKVAAGNPVFYSQDNCVINRNTKTLVLGCPASVIPDDGSITAIGDYAFSDVAITQVSIPQGVTKIGSNAFYCCYVESVYIPDTVTEICEDAFSESCLTDIYYSGTMEQWQAITKTPNWDSDTGNYVVHCTDGDYQKS